MAQADSQIGNEDGNEAGNDICRFCQDRDPENELVAPCNCTGSVKYVHTTCLYRWVASSNSIICNLCGVQYAQETRYTGFIPETLLKLILDKDYKIYSIGMWVSWTIMSAILLYAVLWRMYDFYILSKLTWEKLALYKFLVTSSYIIAELAIHFFENTRLYIGGGTYRLGNINFQLPTRNILAVCEFLLANHHIQLTGWNLPVITLYYTSLYTLIRTLLIDDLSTWYITRYYQHRFITFS